KHIKQDNIETDIEEKVKAKERKKWKPKAIPTNPYELVKAMYDKGTSGRDPDCRSEPNEDNLDDSGSEYSEDEDDLDIDEDEDDESELQENDQEEKEDENADSNQFETDNSDRDDDDDYLTDESEEEEED
ncbi:hypothetical protein BGZ46_008369, partial [Entomortierella lignicola]